MKLTPVLVLALALTGLATAQTPIPHPVGGCGFAEPPNSISPKEGFRLEEFAIPQGDLCDQYTYPGGWDETMRLYLGQGAEEYLPLIEQAVEVWNRTIILPEQEPLIEISERHPRNYRLPGSFWENSERDTDKLSRDGESVIYFTPSSEEERNHWGLADVRGRGFGPSARSLEADVYINTHDEEEYDGNLALTELLVSHDENLGIYAFVDKTYAVILHELGHAVGLSHIPVTGNVMSRKLASGIAEQWTAPMALHIFNHTAVGLFSSWNIPFMDLHDWISPYMELKGNKQRIYLMDMFTKSLRLGAQEKMALACIYEY